jgi:ABC-type polysaccharide/polyol phosphate export permease
MKKNYFTTNITNTQLILNEIKCCFKIQELKKIHFIALSEIKLKYRRSIIGPLWITLSILMYTLGISFFFSVVLNRDFQEYVSHVCVGIVFWTFLTASFLESTSSLSHDLSSYKASRVSYTFFFLKNFYKNLIYLIHHSLYLILFLFIIGDLDLSLNSIVLFLLPLPIILNIQIMISIISSRYDDFPPIIANLMQLLFFTVPILWGVNDLDGFELFKKIAEFNPFYQMLISFKSVFNMKYLVNLNIGYIFIYYIITSGIMFWLFCKTYRRISNWS